MQGRLISEFIKVYSGALNPQRCAQLIERFEASPGQHQLMQREHQYSFTQLDVTANWPEVDSEIEQIMNAGYRQYRMDLKLQSFWPANFFHEALRMKRYLPGGNDGFPPHVDVMDQSTSNRFCTALIYLNDPGEGGETIFPDARLRIQPHPGMLLIFPPLWVFPHAGMPPRRNPKYILHSYLWYPRPDKAAAA